jgi:N-acetyl-gamma-glutamylphosphate reductase
LKGEKDVQEYLNRLTSEGKVFMTPTVYNGIKGIRAAFVNWRTDAEDVELIWKEMNSYYPPISTVTSSFKG